MSHTTELRHLRVSAVAAGRGGAGLSRVLELCEARRLGTVARERCGEESYAPPSLVGAAAQLGR